MAASLARVPLVGALVVSAPAAGHPPLPKCSAAAANCASAGGTVIYLESVDPDGDGDLHLVLAGGHVTAPGLSVLDIERSLRPRRDPRIGDWAAGSGPVYRGSYGQRQIQVERLVIARRD
jgi:hypothetical protein